MKKILFVSAVLVSLALSSANAFAGSSASCPACPASTKSAKVTLPVPVKVVHPTGLPRQYENITVHVALTIDENGVPHNVKPAGQMPSDLAARLLPAVSQWRFTPSQSADGKAIATNVVLPLELVEGTESNTQPAYAAVASVRK